MPDWREMKTYVGFDDAVDGPLLNALAPAVDARMDWIVEGFYERVLAHEGTRSVLESEEQIARLKRTQAQWLRELLAGPWDDAYFDRRYRIGQVHVRVGLAEQYMFTAMNVMRRYVCMVAQDALEDSSATCNAVCKAMDLDLAVMTSSYMEAHEHIELAELRDLLIENLPVTVLLLDSDGVVVSATRADSRLFGAGEAEGLYYRDYLPDELVEAADLPTAVGRALAEAEVVTLSNIVLELADEHRYFEVTLVPLDHQRVRLLVYLEEVSEAVRAGLELQRVENLARIGVLAANVAHEIRNPLAAISNTLQVIRGTMPTDDRRVGVLAKVGEQVLRLDRLVSDLLNYARPPKLTMSRVDCVDIARDAIFESGVPVELGEAVSCSLHTDPQLVRQVLVNLLQNARDAAGPEGTVSMTLAHKSFEVTDDGPGVAPEVVGKLFEPFVTTKAKGTGLGLAICQKIADTLGAKLEYVERDDTGACFRLTLP